MEQAITLKPSTGPMHSAAAADELFTRGAMALGVLIGGDEARRAEATALGAPDEWLLLASAALSPPGYLRHSIA